MALPTTTVEVNFTTSIFEGFTLDDSVRGVLDNTNFTLGGGTLVFTDITSDVLSVQVNRGKSRILDHFTSGRATIRLQNRDREYDPFYSAGPRFGQITTQREMRIQTAGSAVYFGQIDDWSFEYDVNRDSVATMYVTDALATFAAQTLGTAFAPIQQTTGARINAVLNRPEVGWPGGREIDTGLAVLAAASSIPANTKVLNYLQTIEKSEPGDFYVDASGNVAFKERNTIPADTAVTFSDTGLPADIPYIGLDLDLSSQLLYNQVSVTRQNGITQTANDIGSQAQYGVQSLVLNDILLSTDAAALDLATWLVNIYKNPLVRVQRIETELAGLSTTQQAQVLSFELGEIAQLSFTPNGIGDPINVQVKIIGINHSITPNNHRVTFETDSTATNLLILDDLQFGILNLGLLGF